ncbi:DUF6199 family natural product biosynthesis protein [Acutalibacter intestini]|uniref:DUF6199 family natural product biosynthesis protein n=1 Tax=Acutalibacter intestini TaxID=3093659 RepID=UPI002AC8C510|nr:DUF6199 family natural product biosynthesis protein [Acutalibacter sp. M00204]
MSKNTGFVIATILCLGGAALCVFSILKPEVLWNIFEKWKSNGATESSYDYDFHCKVSGVVGLVIIVYLLASLLCTWFLNWDFPLGAWLFGAGR